jgi:hypothetical protein
MYFSLEKDLFLSFVHSEGLETMINLVAMNTSNTRLWVLKNHLPLKETRILRKMPEINLEHEVYKKSLTPLIMPKKKGSLS